MSVSRAHASAPGNPRVHRKLEESQQSSATFPSITASSRTRICRPSEQALVPALNASVLDVTCELPLQVQPPAYLSIPVWDTHCPTPAQLDVAVLWAERQVAAGRTVLVHCAHGHGRSAAVLAAILIARGVAETPEEAEALMRAQRPNVKLNARQRRGVELWARSRNLKRTE